MFKEELMNKYSNKNKNYDFVTVTSVKNYIEKKVEEAKKAQVIEKINKELDLKKERQIIDK